MAWKEVTPEKATELYRAGTAVRWHSVRNGQIHYDMNNPPAYACVFEADIGPTYVPWQRIQDIPLNAWFRHKSALNQNWQRITQVGKLSSKPEFGVCIGMSGLLATDYLLEHYEWTADFNKVNPCGNLVF